VVTSADVSAFVKEVQNGKVKENRSTPGMNDNDIRESQEGYSAATKMKPSASQPGAPPRPVSTSVTSF
jgi:hypothetical protein